jgi:hypothetical protein
MVLVGVTVGVTVLVGVTEVVGVMVLVGVTVGVTVLVGVGLGIIHSNGKSSNDESLGGVGHHVGSV